MDRRRRTQLSKRLSYHLRHDPESAGLELDRAGWASVDRVLATVKGLTRREDLEAVLRGGDKQRFELKHEGDRIRARYGHSIDVDPDHAPAAPPDTLFHGTAQDRVDRILDQGLKRMARRQVHLSERASDAEQVGRRHGRPVVLEVAAGRMHADGFEFSYATDGVWLVDEVPPRYLTRQP